MHTSKIKEMIIATFKPYVCIECEKVAKFGWAKLALKGLQGPLSEVGMDSPEGPLPAPGGYLFLGSTVSKMWEAEKCPHPRVPLSGTPTAHIRGREMIVQWVPYTAPVFIWCKLQR